MNQKLYEKSESCTYHRRKPTKVEEVVERILAHIPTKMVVEERIDVEESTRDKNSHFFSNNFAPGTQLLLVKHFRGGRGVFPI